MNFKFDVECHGRILFDYHYVSVHVKINNSNNFLKIRIRPILFKDISENILYVLHILVFN